MSVLPLPFYARPARAVARALLGKCLVRRVGGVRVSGRIVETEAYCDDPHEPDLACHGSRNGGRPTARTAVMFGPPGRAFVYRTYGIHWMLNVVAGATGVPSVVLLRAVEPLEGRVFMAARRAPHPARAWTNGPGKLTQALAIDGRFDGTGLCDPAAGLWLEDAPPVPAEQVATGPRIGLGVTPEPWLSVPWRYWVRGHPAVSRRAGSRQARE